MDDKKLEELKQGTVIDNSRLDEINPASESLVPDLKRN